jgi:hypothetical protein
MKGRHFHNEVGPIRSVEPGQGVRQIYIVRHPDKQPKSKISLGRVLGYLLLLAYCLLVWGVILSWPFVGWQTSAVGIALCVLTFLGGWLFFFFDDRGKT